MADEQSPPLLSLVKDQGLIDDLQYEEVLGEFKRTAKPVIQILQDFGIMDLDAILQTISNHLSAPVITLQERDLAPELLRLIPAKTAHTYQCLPVSLQDSTLQVALVDPLNVSRLDDIAFIVKKDIQLVITDPVQVEKAIEKFYPQESENVSDILKELGEDQDIAKEVSEAEITDDAGMMERFANQAPIVKFVNLVVFQAVQDRASDIHFEPFETGS